MSLFLVTFFLIYGSVHAYALLKARSALGFGWGATLAVSLLLALLVAAPLIVYFFARPGMEGAARAVSWIGYVWMGLLFFFFWMSLSVDAVNLAARIAGAVTGRRFLPHLVGGPAPFLALAALAAAFGVYALVEAAHIRVERVRIASDKIAAGAPPLRIAQISDVHLGLIVRRARARAIADLVRREHPDVLVCTGDLVDGDINHLEGLAEILRGIDAPLGKYAVTGNHEFYAGIDQALEFTRRAGFTVLRGESVTAANGLRIAGVDDPTAAAFGLGLRSEADALGKTPSPGFTLFLKHRPWLSAASRGLFDLQLSGHTHDGQIFPFRLFVRITYPLLAGLRALDGGGFLYTSRGTGTWGPPMRFLAPPEVTIFTIEGKGRP